jgi:hypothetical protein
MQTPQDKQASAPVELSTEQLELVAGGLPRGGWDVPTTPPVDGSDQAATTTTS